MTLSVEGIAAVGEDLRRAAMGEMGWDRPLDRMIDLLGMRSGQLVAFGRDSLVPLNIMTRMDDSAAVEFVEIDGGNPAVNSKVRAGLSKGELEVLDEADYDTAGDRAKSPEFAAWMDRHDIGYCCVSTLVRTPDSLVGIAALQSASGEGLNAEGKHAFGLVAGAARSAVLLREAIEERGLNLLTPALEGARLAAAICDITGRIRAMTASAERIVSDQKFGRLTDGKFVPHNVAERQAFHEQLVGAIQSWARSPYNRFTPCTLTSRDQEKLVVEIVPMPPEHAFSFSAAAMILFKVPNDVSARRARIAATLYGLTTTETLVAEFLLRGLGPTEIAARTKTTVGTVRNHVHRILSKAECNSQVAFFAQVAMLE